MKFGGALPTGDAPGSCWFGECQDEAVAGDFPGDVSSLRDCAADNCPILRPNGA